ncbi:beta-lactamase superfamily domain-containing protein [Amylocarpus encephaloides]|uniref:Beta-lactamase superfamily domain-containing protein n=1 Tax=Amylocarpus encephaloides TaxID=45428 RepID=A0A9P7YTH4_9HELO|nr:beta-lactamase superfamily domain-containing protein [Amylocarpus encephaloides]
MRPFLRFFTPRKIRNPPLRTTSVWKRSVSGGMATAAIYACSMTNPTALGAVPEDSAKKSHHLKHGKGFVNPWESWRDQIAVKIGMAMLWKHVTGQLKWPDTTPPTVTVRKPEFLPSREASTSLRATWLGHACYYVEFPGGLRVLFDPVFEERCSPSSWMGPKRYTKVPCVIKDLPVVDVVVISHSHYDHLSHPTILELHKHHPNAQFMVGLGLKKWFKDSGVTNVQELDWWQDVDITFSPSTGEKRISTASAEAPTPSTTTSDMTARISCLPCQHTSARTAFDRNETLWCSWAVTSGGKSVWFGGDTGYRAVPELPKDVDDYGEPYANLPFCPAFKQIGELRGPFDLGLIPIGAYDPRHIMSPMHANPFDSVNIFVDAKCKRAMGIHWGTWALTVEDVLEPPILLKQAMKKKGLEETGVFDVCDIGESREF